MLRYGFYDAMNGDRTYDAEDMGRLFDGIIRDGVIMYSGEHQEEDDGNPLPLSTIAVNTQQAYGVEVAPGRAWFNGTWTDLSRDAEGQSALFFQIEPNASAVTKYYFVVLVVDKRPISSARQNTIMLVPNTPQHGLYNSDNVYTYVLSKVEVTSNGIGVTNYIGSNTFTFDSVSYKAAPFVTAPLQQLDIDQILAEWYFRALDMVDEAVEDYFDGTTVVTGLGDIGGGRASCDTATGGYYKLVNIANYKFVDGGMVVVNFEHALIGNSALQINPGSGYLAAKKIFYHRSQYVEAGVVNDGTSVLMVYNASLDSGNGAFEIIVTDNISSSKPAGGWAETDLADAVQAKLNRIQNGYTSCSTGSSNATKQATLNGYSEVAGSIISILFINKVNSGASLAIRSSASGSYPTGKAIHYNGAAINTGVIPAGAVATFIYDGTYYNLIGIDLNGNGIGACTDSGATRSVSIPKFAGVAGSIIAVRFTNSVPAGCTLNVSLFGAKDIYHKNAAIAANVIGAGDTATFMYDGTRFHLLGTDAPSSSGSGVDNIDNVVYIPVTYSGTSLVSTITATDVVNNLVVENKNILYCIVDPDDNQLAFLDEKPSGPAAEISSVLFSRLDYANSQVVVYELFSSGSILRTYTPLGGTMTLPELGGGYATCGGTGNTESTVARTATISGYVLTTGNGPTIKFTTAVNASNPTLNIGDGLSDTGAKAIWYRGAAVPSGFITTGSIVKFVYDGTHYCIESIDKEFYVKDPGGIPASDLASDAKPLVVHLTSAGGGNFTSDVSETNIIAAAAAGQTVVMVTATGLAYYIGDDGDDDTAFYGFEKSGSGSIWYPARYVVSGTTVTKTIQTYSGSGGIVPTPTAQEAGYVAVAKSDGTVEWKALSSLLTAWTPSNPYGGGN